MAGGSEKYPNKSANIENTWIENCFGYCLGKNLFIFIFYCLLAVGTKALILWPLKCLP